MTRMTPSDPLPTVRKKPLFVQSPLSQDKNHNETRPPNCRPSHRKSDSHPDDGDRMPSYRTREYLTEAEIEKLIKAAKDNRYGHRDATMILVAFRHGLRASELIDLRWDQIDFNQATLHVRRVKQGTPCDASDSWATNCGPAAAAARAGAQVAVRVHERAGLAFTTSGLCQTCGARR